MLPQAGAPEDGNRLTARASPEVWLQREIAPVRTEAGLESEGGVVAGRIPVDRRFDAGPGIVQEHRRRVDREAIVGVGGRAAEPEP
jgi:hypothetical protein